MKLGEALARVDGMKPNGYTAGGNDAILQLRTL